MWAIFCDDFKTNIVFYEFSAMPTMQFMIWMDAICKADEFGLNLPEIPGIAEDVLEAVVEEVVEATAVVADAHGVTLQDLEPTTDW